MKFFTIIIIIFTMLYSTIGVGVNVYYCSKTKDVNHSYFEQFEECCKTKNISNCCSNSLSKNKCCTGDVKFIHLGSDIYIENVQIDKTNLLLTPFLLKKTLYKNLNIEKKQIFYCKKRPPPLIKEKNKLQPLFQVFII